MKQETNNKMTSNSYNAPEFITSYQKKVLARREKVKEAYLSHSSAILMKKVSPFQIMCHLSESFGMTLGGIRKILLETGVYVDKQTPVVK